MVLGLMIAGSATAEPPKDGTGSIKGLVIGAKGSVTVYLQSADDNPVRYYDGYKVAAEQDGTFTFLEVKPGTYRINAEASGFMLAPTGNDRPITITLRANEMRGGVRISMVPVTQVCGRITDNGAPRKSSLKAWRLDPEFGTLSESKIVSTGDDGSYRFSDLAPGTYFVETNTAWYPHATLNDFQDAKPIVVGPDVQHGVAECKFDISMQYATSPDQLRSCHPAKVHTSIAQVAGVYNQQFMVSFRHRNPAGGSVWVFNQNGEKRFKAGDSFDESLCPGDYEVVLTDNTRMSLENEILRHKVVFDTQEISLGEDETKDVALTLHPMATIQGEVHFEDITRREICPARGGQYVAILREGDGQFQNVNLGGDNHFTFQNVAPGDYQLYIGSILREAVFMKSLVVDGKAYQDRRFSISAPQSDTKDISISGGQHFSITVGKPVKMDITLSGDIAKAEGHVSPDIRGEPRWDVASTRPRGSVSGRITGGQSEGLTVKLDATHYNSDASYENTTSPAQDGTFQFAEVDQGVYTLSVEGKNFLINEYGALGGGKQGTPIVVTRGAHIEGLTLNPLKLSSICGLVTDAEGAPRPEVRIQIERYQNGYLNGTIYAQDQHITDQNGLFRADGFSPGDYFIHYISYMYHGTPGGYGFLSGDGSLQSAKVLHFVSGQDVGCSPSSPLELKMPLGNRSLHKISGTMAGNLTPDSGDRFWVSLMDENEDGAQVIAGNSKLDTEHNFNIEGVPTGRYILELHSGYGPEPMTWSGPYPPRTHLLARQPIEVQDADISDVKITPIELPTVTGQVHFTDLPESWQKTFNKTTVWIRLVPRTDQPPSSAQVSSDESFRVGPVDAGEYEVGLQWDFNKQIYIRSIRLNGQPIEGRYLRLRPNEPVNLEMEISGSGNQVNFSVLPDASLPPPEPHLTEVCRSLPISALEGMEVILLPDPLFTDGSNPATSIGKNVFRATRVSDGGRTWLQIRNVPPGKYRAIAAEHLSSDSFAKFQDISSEGRALLKALAELGLPLTVEPNSTQEISLPDRTIDVARLAAKMGLNIDTAILGPR